MTELLVRTLARRRLSRLARPSAVAVFALAIAYGGGLWLTFLHHVEGGHERSETPLVLHWLRDSTLALPLICAAVWVAIVLARKLIERLAEAERSLALGAVVTAATVALATTVAVSLPGPAHAGLFGASHGGEELSFLAHLGRDALVALAVDLVLSGIVAAALLRRRPWAAPRIEKWAARPRLPQRALLYAGLALVLVAPVAILAGSGVELVSAQSAGSPCPSGAPLKRYSVQAIDVRIPLNRFGHNDPDGKMYVLSDRVDDVRRQEASRRVSIGLRDDAIQPLVIRANLGDCVEIDFTNNASGGDYGVHIDGLAFDTESSGDAVGRNPSSAVSRGQSRTYRFFVPRDKEVEGTKYMRPGPGARNAVSHGLFGALAVEPEGSTYLSMDTGEPIASGWEATIKPPGRKAFREYVQLYHEIGNENYQVSDGNGGVVGQVGEFTESYRPATRAINYRTEPFDTRMSDPGEGTEEAQGYSSYVFGDPATPIQRSYVGDPTKIRIVHAGSEVFHVFHMHGGGIRWRLNPNADKTYSYEDTGLNKTPVQDSASQRIDSQSFGPGESYDLEIEGGAGGVQQGAGEFLFHCHIAEHYVSGMWGFWRVFDTKQPGLAALPDRAEPPAAVDSAGLIGRTMPDGSTITRDNLDDWIRPQLPPRGVSADDDDASVWDWTVDDRDPARPLYLGEPADTQTWPNYTSAADGGPDRRGPLPSLLPGDEVVGNRPKILFNPRNGRPAFPLLRPHLGKRPPFAPNEHSGAPYLGERGDRPKQGPGVDPFAGRADGVCPASAPTRTFNIVSINVPVPVTKTTSDPSGQIFVLAEDAEAVLNGSKEPEPLAIRANIGDCVAVTLTNRMSDVSAFNGFSKSNLHIHDVQFDTQASDGVITGLSYEQSIEDYPTADPQLAAGTAPGARTIQVTDATKFKPGVAIGVGLGTPEIELRTVTDVAGNTLTLDRPLENPHSAGHATGTEFVQSRWYADVNLDNVFFHDHVDGIRSWSRGLVGQLIVEPKGSRYFDPKTDKEIKSGAIADIRTSNPLAKGLIDGSFREFALWTIDDNPITDSTINLRAEPWAQRLGVGGNPDPSLLFSSYTHGDPKTPVLRAYKGDPVAIRTINVGPAIDTLKVDGHRFYKENRQLDPDTGKTRATPTDTLHYGVSEAFTAILEGGAGGPEQSEGDFLYFNGISRRFEQGAWGLLRVLPKRRRSDLAPLPGTTIGTGSIEETPVTGGRPPTSVAEGGAGQSCPSTVPTREVAVSAIDLPTPQPGRVAAFVPTSVADDVRAGTRPAEPLVVHVAAGECLEVVLTNERVATAADPKRASFNVGKLDRTAESTGANVGFNAVEQSVVPGESKTYRYYASTQKLGSAVISDFGSLDPGANGMYGAVVVAPSGATFSDPISGAATRFGAQVDVTVPGGKGYRDFTTILADKDEIIGGNFMPYVEDVAGPALVNYETAPRGDTASAFSNAANGGADPATPVLRAYAGDPVKVHAIVAPGSEQEHVFGLGGPSWATDPAIPGSDEVTAQAIGPWQGFDIEPIGGAGGRNRATGDFFYGDVRRPFTLAGQWGIMRVLSDPQCPLRPLAGMDCVGEKSLLTAAPPPPATDNPPPPPPPAAPTASAPALPRATPPPGNPGDTRTEGSSGDELPALRGLSISSRLGLGSLRRRGLRIRVMVPREDRVVHLRLLRRRRVALRRDGKIVRRTINRTVATKTMRIRRGGDISVTWKLSRSQLRRVPAGSYELQLRSGRTRDGLRERTLKDTIRLTGSRSRRG